jgi:hypothetical protein
MRLILPVLLLIAAASGQPPRAGAPSDSAGSPNQMSGPVPAPAGPGIVDWSRMVVRATGSCTLSSPTPSARAQSAALRTARTNAQRRLVEAALAVKVAVDSTVVDLCRRKDALRRRVEGLCRNAPVAPGSVPAPAGRVDVTLELPLYGPNGLASVLLDAVIEGRPHPLPCPLEDSGRRAQLQGATRALQGVSGLVPGRSAAQARAQSLVPAFVGQAAEALEPVLDRRPQPLPCPLLNATESTLALASTGAVFDLLRSGAEPHLFPVFVDSAGVVLLDMAELYRTLGHSSFERVRYLQTIADVLVDRALCLNPFAIRVERPCPAGWVVAQQDVERMGWLSRLVQYLVAAGRPVVFFI